MLCVESRSAGYQPLGKTFFDEGSELSGLDDLSRSARGAGQGGVGDLLGGLGGGGLGSVLGGILGGGGARGGGLGGGLGGGNPLLRLLLPAVASMLMNGGLQKILGRLQQSGSGQKGQSWVASGQNEPVDAADIRGALDDQELAQIAKQLGVSEEEAAEAVAQVLPDVVDQATPEGELPGDEELDKRLGRLHELGGAER